MQLRSTLHSGSASRLVTSYITEKMTIDGQLLRLVSDSGPTVITVTQLPPTSKSDIIRKVKPLAIYRRFITPLRSRCTSGYILL